MRSSTRALSLLALGLGLGGLGGLDRQASAAPTTPPPPRSTSTTPPPPSGAGKPTSTSPSGKAAGTTSQPSAAAGAGPSTTPPPPTVGPAAEADPNAAIAEPEVPPQDLSSTWGYSRTQPLSPRYVRTDDPSFAAPNPVGFYSGVSVQGNHVPPFPAKQVGAPPVVMTWTGFERAPEGSRVFFQLSAEATHEVTTKGLVLQIRMRNTKVNVRNNMRYLDLRYFETPVRTVKVTRKGRDTVATIALKRDAVPTVQIIDGKAGYKLLVVQFSDGVVAELP